jgi:N-acetylglutamate synthase-like GNAT family acetyltransferase
VKLRRADTGDLAAIVALQRAAYAKNRPILGVEPLPLLVDYADILKSHEVWLAERAGELEGVLILQAHADHLLIWSVAITPALHGRGLGKTLLTDAEARARELGLAHLRLYTGEPLTGNIAWYERHGYVRERIEDLGDRRVVHMVKDLGGE